MNDLRELERVLDGIRARYYYRLYRNSLKEDGGAGSGNWGHSGRPGIRGGSMPGGGVKNRISAEGGGYTSAAKQRKAAKKAAKKTGSSNQGGKRARALKECRDSMDACTNTMQKIQYARGGADRDELVRRLEATVESPQKAKTLLQEYQENLKSAEQYTGKRTETELEERIRKAEQDLEEYDRKHPGEKEDIWNWTPERRDILAGIQDNQATLEALRKVEAAERDVQSLEQRAQRAKEQLESLKNSDGADEAELTKQYNALAEECYKKTLETFKSASDCKTADDATAYLRAKKYYADQGSNFINDTAVDLRDMTDSHAVETAKSLESLFTDYSGLKGKLRGIQAKPLAEGIFGVCWTSNSLVQLNSDLYGGGGKAEDLYQVAAATGQSPPGTDSRSVVTHEFAHAIDGLLSSGREQLSDEIMARVIERLHPGTRGIYNIAGIERIIREDVSRYAANNRNTQSFYDPMEPGRNMEFLADAFAEYRTSPQPREVARVVGEEMEQILKERLQ